MEYIKPDEQSNWKTIFEKIVAWAVESHHDVESEKTGESTSEVEPEQELETETSEGNIKQSGAKRQCVRNEKRLKTMRTSEVAQCCMHDLTDVHHEHEVIGSSLVLSSVKYMAATSSAVLDGTDAGCSPAL